MCARRTVDDGGAMLLTACASMQYRIETDDCKQSEMMLLFETIFFIRQQLAIENYQRYIILAAIPRFG